MDESKKIYANDEVFAQIKDKRRKAYFKSWKDFKNFNIDFEFLKRRPLLIILNISDWRKK